MRKTSGAGDSGDVVAHEVVALFQGEVDYDAPDRWASSGKTLVLEISFQPYAEPFGS
jgi:hypothetical protein